MVNPRSASGGRVRHDRDDGVRRQAQARAERDDAGDRLERASRVDDPSGIDEGPEAAGRLTASRPIRPARASCSTAARRWRRPSVPTSATRRPRTWRRRRSKTGKSIRDLVIRTRPDGQGAARRGAFGRRHDARRGSSGRRSSRADADGIDDRGQRPKPRGRHSGRSQDVRRVRRLRRERDHRRHRAEHARHHRVVPLSADWSPRKSKPIAGDLASMPRRSACSPRRRSSKRSPRPSLSSDLPFVVLGSGHRLHKRRAAARCRRRSDAHRRAAAARVRRDAEHTRGRSAERLHHPIGGRCEKAAVRLREMGAERSSSRAGTSLTGRTTGSRSSTSSTTATRSPNTGRCGSMRWAGARHRVRIFVGTGSGVGYPRVRAPRTGLRAGAIARAQAIGGGARVLDRSWQTADNRVIG